MHINKYAGQSPGKGLAGHEPILKGAESMDAREFLGRARFLESLVQSKLRQVESLKSLACRVTTVYSEEPVSHTRNVSGMEDIIIRIMETEEELNHRIDELVEAKLQIDRVIDKVDNPQLQVILQKKYLDYMTLVKIGFELNVSKRWMRELHRQALEEVQRILDEEA